MVSWLQLHKGVANAWGEYVRQLIAAQASRGSVQQYHVKNACAQWEHAVSTWHPHVKGEWVYNADGTRDYRLGATLFVAGETTRFDAQLGPRSP